jgi:hypothetical protein
MAEENKIQSMSEADQPKPKYDFSKVNFATGEGAQLEFDSWDEMEAYFDAYDEASKKAGFPI